MRIFRIFIVPLHSEIGISWQEIRMVGELWRGGRLEASFPWVVIEKVSIGRVTRTECASYVAGRRGGGGMIFL